MTANWILIVIIVTFALYKASGCIMNFGACV